MNETGSQHLVVLGLMGVGKSTTAYAVATALSLPCFDSDTDLETSFGLTGGQIASSLGVNELHHVESAMLLARLANPEPSVIAAAASIVEDELCRQALAARATVVVLHAPIVEILRRSATGVHRRTMPEAELTAVAHRRAPLFEAVADRELDAMLSTSELVAQILRHLAES